MTSSTPKPIVFGSVILSDGDLAVLAGSSLNISLNSKNYTTFDNLQIAVLDDSTPTALNPSNALSFPSGADPDGEFQQPNVGSARIAAVSGGGMAVLTWGGQNEDYYLQILNNAGTVTTAPEVVASQGNNASNASGAAGAVATWSGGIVAAWSTNDGADLFYQRFNNTGTAQGGAIQVSTSGLGGLGAWSGQVSVDSLGDVIFGIAGASFPDPGYYVEYNDSNIRVGATNLSNLLAAPLFAPVPGGGFVSVVYDGVNLPNFSKDSYNSFVMQEVEVSNTGTLSVLKNNIVPTVSQGGALAPNISWINTAANGTFEFLEAGATKADTFTISSPTPSQTSVALPTLGYATAPATFPAATQPPSANLTGGTFAGVGINSSNQLVAEGLVSCFVTGTRIRTTGGALPVEALRAGDLVLTWSGEARPIRWIGHRTITPDHHPSPKQVRPLRIAANTFGPGMPERALYVSPDHAICIDDVDAGAPVLVPCGLLENGGAIASVDRGTVTYWHIELDSHDVILAEGLPVESYLEAGNRDNFENGGGSMRLFADFSPPSNADHWESAGCLRLVLTGPLLDAARRRAAGNHARPERAFA
jgi:hypothetical protein